MTPKESFRILYRSLTVRTEQLTVILYTVPFSFSNPGSVTSPFSYVEYTFSHPGFVNLSILLHRTFTGRTFGVSTVWRVHVRRIRLRDWWRLNSKYRGAIGVFFERLEFNLQFRRFWLHPLPSSISDWELWMCPPDLVNRWERRVMGSGPWVKRPQLRDLVGKTWGSSTSGIRWRVRTGRGRDTVCLRIPEE